MRTVQEIDDEIADIMEAALGRQLHASEARTIRRLNAELRDVKAVGDLDTLEGLHADWVSRGVAEGWHSPSKESR